jgi:hypothetical protein
VVLAVTCITVQARLRDRARLTRGASWVGWDDPEIVKRVNEVEDVRRRWQRQIDASTPARQR